MGMDRVFYIFRHGETDWNKAKRCQGHSNTALNELGLQQAKTLGSKMTSLPIEIIYSSDLDRAFHTGKTVSEMCGVEIIKDARLREMNYGVAEGQLFEDAIKAHGQELWQKLMSFTPENDSAGFPDGETRKEARERFLEVLYEIIDQTEHKHIAISTHGGTLRNVLHSFLPSNHELIPIPNCVLYTLTYKSREKNFVVDLRPL